MIPSHEDQGSWAPLKLEPLSAGAGAENIDFEQILYQALVNEEKHIRVLNAKRPQFSYSEKQLRDAAAAEVAQQNSSALEEDKSNKKRKQASADEKAKQNRDRNREHARNTRLRKKAYVSKLKELVEQLTQQKDIEERERRILGESIYDTVWSYFDLMIESKYQLIDFLCSACNTQECSSVAA